MTSSRISKRVYTFITVIVLIFSVFLVNLYRLQIVRGESEGAAVSTVKVGVKAARGEIVDRNGLPLVVNRQGNDIVFDHSYFPASNEFSKRVAVIHSLITMFEKYKVEWIDDLPLEFSASGVIEFKPDCESNIKYLKSADFLNLNSYATAQNCFDALIERYSLEDYDSQTARKIASVCYNMKRLDFAPSLPYTFAKDAPDALVAKIKENSADFPGVDVDVCAVREYIDGTVAPHILGIVGVINAEEYADKKDDGYGYNDTLGKSGIELAMEDTLRGSSGVKTITTDADGNKTSEYTTPPVPGNTVQLTIDSGLQKVAQNALEKRIDELQYRRNYQMTGSVIAIDVNTGEVLCSATAPSYNASTYSKDAEKLNKDESAPLWNRALMSAYTPGSTIKLAVAMGALEEGTIDDKFRFTCYGRYTHYSDYQPRCISVHSTLDVTNAIYNSCNIFFYETSRLMGITALNKYFSVFGLGTKTGVELSEAEGNIDSVAYRESIGEVWTPGLTIQAGIGHGSNLFTPIQLCNYVSMVATRGTRYGSHFVKGILSYDRKTVLSEVKPEVVAKVDFDQHNWELVQRGMYKVANEGTANFDEVPVTVAAKTGTTTISKMVNGKFIETNNGILIAYAPYENPQIAVCTIVEGAGSGSSTAPIVSDIMKYYFSDSYGTGEVEAAQ